MGKQKLHGTLPSPLFDSSGGSQVRFVGPKAYVEVHWAKFGAKIAQGKLVCANGDPDDEDPDEGLLISNSHKEKAIECKACKAGVQSKTRGAAIGWDVTANRWCLFMASPSVFSDVFSKCKKYGVTPEVMIAGDGPNVIIQRAGMATIVEIVPESIGSRPQGKEKPPDLSMVLAGMRKRSVWTKYSTPEDIDVPVFLGTNTSSGHNFILPTDAIANPSDKPKGERMDGSSPIVKSRWEIID